MKPELWLQDYARALRQLTEALLIKVDHDVVRAGCNGNPRSKLPGIGHPKAKTRGSPQGAGNLPTVNLSRDHKRLA
jgi:hypothetical protein